MIFPDEGQVKILMIQPKYGDNKFNIFLLAETKEGQFFVFLFLAIRLLHWSVQVGQSLISSCCFFSVLRLMVVALWSRKTALMFGRPSKRQ